MDRPRVALVIPALNEARSIGDIVARSAAFGIPVVVDDGSSDGTAGVATAAGADVVVHAQNRGYDAALNSGFHRASELQCDWTITLDADGQHDPKILGSFIAALGDGADVVVGVRDRRQRLSEDLFAWFGRRMWGIEDPLCGMKGYRMTVYEEHGGFDSCSSIGTELAVCAAARGRAIRQVPVRTREREGRPRFGRSIEANFRILRALFAVMRKARRLRSTDRLSAA